MDKYDIPYAFFEEQLEGQRRGIGLTGFSTEEELEEYSRLVAGSVGKMLLPVLSSSYDRKMERACEELGIAMQYTNIKRYFRRRESTIPSLSPGRPYERVWH